MLFQKYVLLCVSAVFLSEYSFGMDKFKNGCIELKDSVSNNKKEVAFKTIGLGGVGFGAGLGLLKLNEESDKKVGLVETIQNNQKLLMGFSVVGVISGFAWGVHSSATKSANKKMIKQRILELENDIQEMENGLNLQNPEKAMEIKILKRLLEKERRRLEELE